MARLAATLLFATLASAQTANYTTTVWMTKFADSDKYGYVASVIDADAQHMALSMDFDADTDKEALLIGGTGGNYTFGASSFTYNELVTNVPQPTGDVNFQVQCTQPAQSGDSVPCTYVLGDVYLRYLSCNEYLTTRTDLPQLKNTTREYRHTYGTGIWGSGGTETVTMTNNYPSERETTTPAWCTSDNVPESVLTAPFTTSAAEFAVYQVVIYAGQEKLSAYSDSSIAVSTGTGSTGSVPAATASAGSSASVAASATGSAPPASTGAAGRKNAVVPALAGMGVAAAMCWL